jgi:hypothetical protein
MVVVSRRPYEQRGFEEGEGGEHHGSQNLIQDRMFPEFKEDGRGRIRRER